jgi:hypothetical protein
VTSCKGCSGNSHPFLEAEGTYTCQGCDERLCRFCYMSEDKIAVLDGDRLLCFECMRVALCGMTEQEDESKMRAFLIEKGKLGRSQSSSSQPILQHVLCQSWCCSSALLLDLWLASRDRTQ